MSQIFTFETCISPSWIDYNGHMRDAYFGLVFSLAVDSFQDKVGFDETYRRETGCTIYLVEDHKRFLKEVKEGAVVRVETRLLGCDAKRFHLYMQMFESGNLAAVGEFMEMHVAQHPQPHAEPMPAHIHARLQANMTPPTVASELEYRSRVIGFGR